MTHPSATTHPTEPLGWARTAIMITAPGLLLVGKLLMLTPEAWTLSHLAFLAGCVAMLPAALVLHTRLAGAPEWLRRSGLALTAIGALVLAGQFVIGFAVMRLAAADAAVAGPLFDQIQGSAALALIFYTAGPRCCSSGSRSSGSR